MSYMRYIGKIRSRVSYRCDRATVHAWDGQTDSQTDCALSTVPSRGRAT